MSFELVAPGGEPSDSRRRARTDDGPKDAWREEISLPERPNQVAYYHPRGCGETGDADCTPERIREICHNNSKTDDADEFPIDGVFFGQKISPPFLKGVKYGEKIDDGGNTIVDGKTRRTNGKDNAENADNAKGTGTCFNDADGEDRLREWTETEMRDPTNRDEIVFLSRATTVRQRVRPKFAAAMEAVRNDPDLRRFLDDGDGYRGRFFRSTTTYLPDPDDPDGVRTEEDTILANAQELAKTCGARVPSNLTDEEKTVFETFKREKFDDLWTRSSLRRTSSVFNRSRSMSMLAKLLKVARATGFAHGEAKIRSRLDEIPATKNEMLNAARQGRAKRLKRLLDSAKKEDVREVSAKLFAEALDSPASNVETVGVLVAHEKKVDVHAALTEDYGEFSEGDGPLRMAIAGANPKPEIFRALLKHPEIDVNKRSNGLTTLWGLACMDFLEEDDWSRWGPMLEALLAHERTIVNATVDDGGTALHAACLTDGEIFSVHDEFVVRMLLDAGANPLARKSNGHTPIDEARGRRNLPIVDLLTVAAATHGTGATRTRKSFPIDRVAEARARLRRGTVRAWLGSREIPSTVVFDPNGERLIVAHARKNREISEIPEIRGIVEIDADTGLRLGNETEFEKSMATTTFSPDGKRIASWNEASETFYLESRESGTLAPETTTMYYEGRDYQEDATFSDDGDTFAVADYKKGSVQVWSFDQRKWTKTNELNKRPTALAFSRRVGENEYLAVGVDLPILARVWNARFDSRPVDVGRWEDGEFTIKIAFSATGERIAAASIRDWSSTTVLKVLESTNGGVSWENTNTVFVKSSVSAFAFNPRNSTLLALVIGRNVELWHTQSIRDDFPDGTLLRRFKNVEGPLAFSPDGTRLAMVSREDGSIVVENIVETFAKAFLENEKTRQTIDVDGPTREHLEILKHARDVEIRVVLANDTLWKLGAFLPNIERLSFAFFDDHPGRLDNHLSEIKDVIDLDSFAKKNSLKKLVLPYVGFKTLPSTIMNIRSLRELEVDGNYLSALPDGLGKLTALRYINLGANYLKEFPKVLEGMPSLRLIQIWNNKDGDGESLVFPSTKFSEALRNKMDKRLLRIDQDGRLGISSELVWGFDGETECENARRLTDDEVRERLRAHDERSKVTHTGTQVLAFLRARYDRKYDDDKDVEKVLSEFLFKEWRDIPFNCYDDCSAFRFALGRIKANCPDPTDQYHVASTDFRTVGGEGEGAVLSKAGVEEFWQWFVSDDFERDMRACARYVADAEADVVDSDEIGREQILNRFRENGFID